MDDNPTTLAGMLATSNHIEQQLAESCGEVTPEIEALLLNQEQWESAIILANKNTINCLDQFKKAETKNKIVMNKFVKANQDLFEVVQSCATAHGVKL